MPFFLPSRRGKLASATKAARNLAFLRAALSLLETRLARRIPGVRPKRRVVTPARAAALGGAVAVVAGFVRSRRSGEGGDGGSAVAPGPTPPPAPANYDAPGPPQNSSTPLPAPASQQIGVDPSIDEDAEIAAAAAEAGAIGGPVSDYASSEPSLAADEAERPLIESGEGEAEGQDQTEAELLDVVTDPYGPGAGMSDTERQIEQAIEDQENPAAGETSSGGPSLRGPQAET